MIDNELKIILDKLRKERPIFCSEADFQLALGMMLAKKYKVRLEYPFLVTGSNTSAKDLLMPEELEEQENVEIKKNKQYVMHTDIVVFKDDKIIPIELKYKTIGKTNDKEYLPIKCDVDNISYYLKNQGAKNNNCYLYLKDIRRIEYLKDKYKDSFGGGYTIFITNDEKYLSSPSSDVGYKNFSLHKENNTKHGELFWINSCDKRNTNGNYKKFELDGNYPIKWDNENILFKYKNYSEIDDFEFHILINKIEK